jgi:hypothetical protein
LSAVNEWGGPSGRQRFFDPSASAGLHGTTRAFGRRVDALLRINLRPFVDPVTGSVSLRPDASGLLDVALRRGLSVVGGAALARSTVSARSSVAGVGFAELRVQPWRAFGVATGLRAAAQPDVRWVAFVAFNLAHHALL